MPPYLRFGSIPRKRHIAHPNVPGFKNEGIYYEEVVTVAGFSRAYSLVYHLRPPTRVVRIEPAGTAVARPGRSARAAASSPEDPVDPPRRRPDHGPTPDDGQRRRDPRPMPAGRAAGRALPQRRRRRDRLRPLRPRRAPHAFRPAALPPARLRRHTAVHDLSARLRTWLQPGPADHRGVGRRLAPGAIPQPRRSDPARCSL